MNAHFTQPAASCSRQPRRTGPVRAQMNAPVRVQSIDSGRFATVWPRGASAFLRPRKKFDVLWLVAKNGDGLRRSEWLRSWHKEEVEMQCRRSNGRKEYFNVKLKRDRLKP